MLEQGDLEYLGFANCMPDPLVQSSAMLVRDSILQSVSGKYGTILIDPPWRFANRTGKVGPEHKRLHNPHIYHVSLGEKLFRQKQDLIEAAVGE